jgi:N-acetylglucosaminyldiphosphoundecaprenol N-acetyl-beta-D-mannosaminyltransferase
MNEKIYFTSIENKKDFGKFLNSKERRIFNFLNANSLYLFKKNKEFSSFLKDFQKILVNFVDGVLISLTLSIKKRKLIRKMPGPDITEFIFTRKDLLKDKKIFLIGFTEQDLNFLCKKYPKLKRKNLSSYNPPYIEGLNFSKKEIAKISDLIKKFDAEYVFIGIGNPKQEFLSKELYSKTKAKYFFNVGAAFDFLSEKKKRAPKILQKIGLEWFYRLISDFKHSKDKVWRSFIALKYLNWVELELDKNSPKSL